MFECDVEVGDGINFCVWYVFSAADIEKPVYWEVEYSESRKDWEAEEDREEKEGWEEEKDLDDEDICAVEEYWDAEGFWELDRPEFFEAQEDLDVQDDSEVEEYWDADDGWEDLVAKKDLEAEEGWEVQNYRYLPIHNEIKEVMNKAVALVTQKFVFIYLKC